MVHSLPSIEPNPRPERGERPAADPSCAPNDLASSPGPDEIFGPEATGEWNRVAALKSGLA